MEYIYKTMNGNSKKRREQAVNLAKEDYSNYKG
jgi:hypothetical protein